MRGRACVNILEKAKRTKWGLLLIWLLTWTDPFLARGRLPLIASPAALILVHNGRLVKWRARHSSFQFRSDALWDSKIRWQWWRTSVVHVVHETAREHRGDVECKFDRRRPCKRKFVGAIFFQKAKTVFWVFVTYSSGSFFMTSYFSNFDRIGKSQFSDQIFRINFSDQFDLVLVRLLWSTYVAYSKN